MKKLLIIVFGMSLPTVCMDRQAEKKEAEAKEKMLEYDLFRWQMWFECGLKLDMPVYKYFSKDGQQFIGSRCNCIEENGCNERMTSEEWNEKRRGLEEKVFDITDNQKK
jgi:hypothetical protein